MTVYTITLLDKSATAIATDYRDALAEATQRARYMLSPEWAAEASQTHERLETWKVEVTDESEAVVFVGHK